MTDTQREQSIRRKAIADSDTEFLLRMLDAARERLESELHKRNEATKVWIQSDTQCRRYACSLERQIELLLKEIENKEPLND